MPDRGKARGLTQSHMRDPRKQRNRGTSIRNFAIVDLAKMIHHYCHHYHPLPKKPSLLSSLFPSIGKREGMYDRKERERASEKEIIRRSKLRRIAFMTVWCTQMSALTVKLSIVFNGNRDS